MGIEIERNKFVIISQNTEIAVLRCASSEKDASFLTLDTIRTTHSLDSTGSYRESREARLSYICTGTRYRVQGTVRKFLYFPFSLLLYSHFITHNSQFAKLYYMPFKKR